LATGHGNQLTRQVGEHLVAAELGRRGYFATPFAGNIPMYDLLADINGRATPIQVKAINGGSWQFDANMFLNIEVGNDGWQIIKGRKQLPRPDLLCIFVLLKSVQSDADKFYIFRLCDLQEHCERVYKKNAVEDGGFFKLQRKKNPKSTHYAVSPKEFAQWKVQVEGNWDLLTQPQSAATEPLRATSVTTRSNT
jgi:hypothetical protein